MTESPDRPPSVAGGLFVPDAQEPDADRAAVLALADGTTWRGWSVGPARAVGGRVRIAGELVLVEGEVVGVLRGVDVVALGRHLADTAAGQGPGTMAYLTAPGAILPIHETVARAIARGEIGRA
jgi:hypothetical protein